MGYRLWVLKYDFCVCHGKKLSKFIECEVPKVI